MHIYNHGNLEAYRTDSIHIAEDLHYSDDIIHRIKKAKTEEEISRILVMARNGGK